MRPWPRASRRASVQLLTQSRQMRIPTGLRLSRQTMAFSWDRFSLIDEDNWRRSGNLLSRSTLVAVLVGTDINAIASRPRVAVFIGGQAIGIALVDSRAAGLQVEISCRRIHQFRILAEDVVLPDHRSGVP